MRGLLPALVLAACRAPAEGTDPTLPPTPTLSTGPVVVDGPLGARREGSEVVFRVASAAAERIEVWLYAEPLGAEAALRLPLTPRDGVFAGAVAAAELDALGLDPLFYGLRAWGPNWPWDPAWAPGTEVGFLADVDGDGNRFDPNKLLIDPFTRELSHDPITEAHTDWGAYTTGDRRAEDTGPVAPKGILIPDEPVDTGARPDRPLRDLVVYEVHVEALSKLDPEVPEPLRGTYAGAALTAGRLADLGIQAIEFLPLAETPNDQNDLTPDAAGDNFWGYSTLAFLAPDRRYAADRSPGGPTREVREMVRAFHEAGIAVWVDGVFNHTTEGGPWDADGEVVTLLSLRGLDNAGYYQLDGPKGYRNDNGVGPNLAAADPRARELVLGALGWWHEGLGFDGFRFDLAPILGNACAAGCFDFDPEDPEGILARAAAELPDAVLVAEPWGATGVAYQAGRFPAGWGEWNDGFRDTLRRDLNLLADTTAPLSALVEALSGSPGRFADDGRLPEASIDFVVAHDGFTLWDLVSCAEKDNDQPWPYGPSDGGSDHNLSSDHGGDPEAQRTAARSLMALTLLAAGTPMFTGGDEWLRSQRCNNNPYNLSSEATWIDWAALEAEGAAFHTFTRRLLAFRAAHPALRPTTWRGPGQVRWLRDDGADADPAYLSDPSRHALAMWLDGPSAGDPARAILVLINGWTGPVTFALPPTGDGAPWQLVADTAPWLEGDANALPEGSDAPLPDESYTVAGGAVVVLIDRP